MSGLKTNGTFHFKLSENRTSLIFKYSLYIFAKGWLAILAMSLETSKKISRTCFNWFISRHIYSLTSGLLQKTCPIFCTVSKNGKNVLQKIFNKPLIFFKQTSLQKCRRSGDDGSKREKKCDKRDDKRFLVWQQSFPGRKKRQIDFLNWSTRRSECQKS